MGFLIEENQPVIWRGPMLNGIIRQFLYQAKWGQKDFLIVDLPPGTGDAQLSLAQAVPMGGVVIVTTPQRVSLQDARRGLAMFKSKRENLRSLGFRMSCPVSMPILKAHPPLLSSSPQQTSTTIITTITDTHNHNTTTYQALNAIP